MLRDVEKIIVQFKRLSVNLTEYEELYDISRALAQAKRIEEVFEIVYTFCARMLPVSTMVFTLANRKRVRSSRFTAKGLNRSPRRTFPHAGSLVGWVIENRKYLVFPQKERKRNVFGRQIELSGDGSLALFPLLWEEKGYRDLLSCRRFSKTPVDVPYPARRGRPEHGRRIIHGDPVDNTAQKTGGDRSADRPL